MEREETGARVASSPTPQRVTFRGCRSIAEAEVRLRAWLEPILNERLRQDVLTMQHHDLSDAEIEAWIDERLAPREADVDAMVVEFRRLAVVPSAPVH